MTITRYLKNKTLFSIRNGLYSTLPLNEVDPYLLGTAYIKGFCYVSLQTILERDGLINQTVQEITLIGGRSLSFTIGDTRYRCKKVKLEFLNNLEGIDLSDDYPVATVERAIADILYFNKDFYFDKNLDSYKEKVKLIQEKVY